MLLERICRLIRLFGGERFVVAIGFCEHAERLRLDEEALRSARMRMVRLAIFGELFSLLVLSLYWGNQSELWIYGKQILGIGSFFALSLLNGMDFRRYTNQTAIFLVVTVFVLVAMGLLGGVPLFQFPTVFAVVLFGIFAIGMRIAPWAIVGYGVGGLFAYWADRKGIWSPTCTFWSAVTIGCVGIAALAGMILWGYGSG